MDTDWIYIHQWIRDGKKYFLALNTKNLKRFVAWSGDGVNHIVWEEMG